MDLVGIEPTTSSMPWKRAPSCATGPRAKGFNSIIVSGWEQFVNLRLLAAYAHQARFSAIHPSRVKWPWQYQKRNLLALTAWPVHHGT